VIEGVDPATDSSPADPSPTAPVPTDPSPSDADLVQAHADGDPHAFASLVARHQDRLWAIALRMMRNPEDAADALQDAYISAFRRAATYRGEARVTTWLHRVVVNACLDRLRSQRVRAADPLPEDLDRVAEFGRAEPDRLEAQEQRDRVVAAMALLNPDQRAALVLVDRYGYPVEEAAVILGCAVGTVKSRCARGRAKLAPLLAVGMEEVD
jgi:RNA polymerase sigma-70 factor (ECF subfamily)